MYLNNKTEWTKTLIQNIAGSRDLEQLSLKTQHRRFSKAQAFKAEIQVKCDEVMLHDLQQETKKGKGCRLFDQTYSLMLVQKPEDIHGLATVCIIQADLQHLLLYFPNCKVHTDAINSTES